MTLSVLALIRVRMSIEGRSRKHNSLTKTIYMLNDGINPEKPACGKFPEGLALFRAFHGKSALRASGLAVPPKITRFGIRIHFDGEESRAERLSL